jgi:hypothetical protein
MIYMQQRLTRWGSFTTVDLPAIRAGKFKLNVSYKSPASLSWSCMVAQQNTPIPRGAFIRVWTDGNDPSGTAFSSSNPLFEGYVDVVEPGSESLGVNYTAYDATYRATKLATIFSAAWPAGTLPSTPPVRPDDAVPRLIYNVCITNDPDWAHQVGAQGTLGQVVAGILEWCYQPLLWSDAAPGDGTDDPVPTAYNSSDLTWLTVKPQDKLDFASEGVRSALDRLNRYEPRMRILFDPSTRLWRVVDLASAPTITVTLNDKDATYPVLSISLRPSTENCVTAVSIYGPPNPETAILDWEDPVNPYGTDPTSPDAEIIPVSETEVIESFVTAGGTFAARWWRTWQIVDADQRAGALLLPDPYTYQLAPTLFAQTDRPTVLLSWDGGSTWLRWDAWYGDQNAGTITFTSIPAYKIVDENGNGTVPASTQKWHLPNALKLIWAPFGEPLQVRAPVTGYEGTAYTEAGLAIEDYQNDEALMIGREFGRPVTSYARREAFQKYAQTLLDQRKDIVWVGGAQIDGLDWRYCRLNKRVQIAAENANGGTLTTGWEAINAWVTDVEYDLDLKTTQLTFSGDRLSLFGIDESLLKTQLNIKAMIQNLQYKQELMYSTRPLPNGRLVNEIVGVRTTPTFTYLDDTQENRDMLEQQQRDREQFASYTFGTGV